MTRKTLRSSGKAGQPRDPRRRGLRADWLLLGLLGLSLAIRLWGIHDRLPDPSLGIHLLDDTAVEETDRTTVGRAWAMWRGGAQPLDPNPHTGGWPALSFYLTLVLQYAYKLYVSVTAGGASAPQLQQHIVGAASAPFYLFARIAGALIGTATLFLTYRLGARCLGRGVGLLAGLLLAVNPLHALTSQHVSDPNLLALLFVLLATPPLLRVAAGGTVWDSVRAGALIGLAGACKYVPLILAAPLVLAHRGLGPGANRERARTLLGNPALWAGLFAIPVALFLGSPFLFIDWRQTLTDITAQRRALFSDWVGQTVFPLSLPSYLAVSIPHAMGWVAYLLGAGGLVLLWRTGRAGRVLTLIPVLIVLANGLLRVSQERYILPALPFLYLGASLAIVRAAGWAHRALQSKFGAGAARVGRALSPALLAAFLAAAAIAWPLNDLLATRHSLSLPDSRHLSRRWINEHLPANARVAVELYGPVFDDAERAIVTWPFFAVHSRAGSPAYHAEFLDGFEYHVASSEISRRFETEPARHPVEVAYYRWLEKQGGVVWESDVSATSGPHIVIRRLRPGISTREQRDSLFAAAMPRPSELDRIELWCVDCSRLFARSGDYERTEEWARRGLNVGVASMEPQLRAGLAMALWYKGQLDSADAEIRAAILEVPREFSFRAYHGGILLEMGRPDQALAELRKAIELDPNHPQAASVREQIAQIEAARRRP